MTNKGNYISEESLWIWKTRTDNDEVDNHDCKQRSRRMG
jgi:hypothetical protein